MKGYEREKSLAREVYASEAYFAYDQLWSFAEQIQHIRRLQPRSVIEVGVGNGFVSGFLRSVGTQVLTFDINPNLHPDVVASVDDINSYVNEREYDLISCCEVLEHLPFHKFEFTIDMFSRLSENLFLTLPVHGTHIGFGGLIQAHRFRRWVGIWQRIPSRTRQLPEMHFWEVDHSKDTSKRAILSLLAKYYSDVDSGYLKANPYHRYFRCRRSRTLHEDA